MKLRVARHTAEINNIIHFYVDILGLEKLGSFTNHDGYDGVFLGIPGENWHLEFTTNQDIPFHQADEDDLLVFYFETAEKKEEIVKKLLKNGYRQVPPKNPYWAKNGTCYLDPDGFGIILTIE
jgi:catechol 2,3-dioxygenase-like lactoylglutathione lyase family enzyme